MVGVSRVRREHISLANEKFFLVGGKRIPFPKLRAAVFGLTIRPRRELGIRRNHAEPLLVGENRAELVEVEGERDHLALAHQLRRRDDILRLRIVERADLIVRAPFAPVLVLVGGLAKVLAREFA
jgi:hypothetical protein